MAELPTYRQAGITYGELPRISTADIELQAKGWGNISQKLDLLGKAVSERVEAKVQAEARQYAIENPISYDQLQDVIQGKQGIASLAPEGSGSIYQKALFEAQGVILAQDLRMRGLREFTEFKVQAKNGKITPEDVYQKMSDLRDGYVATLMSLDPEAAKDLGTVLTTKANTIYEDALDYEVKIFNLEQDERYGKAVEDLRPFARDAFLKPKNDPGKGFINPDLTIEAYKKDIEPSRLALGSNKHVEAFDKMVAEERLNALKDIANDREKFISPSSFKTALESKQLGFYQNVYEGLNLEQKEKLNTHLQTLIKVERKATSDDLSAANSILVGGGKVSDEDVTGLVTRIEALGADAEDLPAKMQSFLYSREILSKWTGFNPAAVQAEINNMVRGLEGQGKEGVDTQLEIDVIETAKKLHKNMVAELEKDAISFANKVGVVEIEPIDFTTPERLAETVQNRIAQSELVQSTYGYSNILTSAEIDTIKSQYDQEDRFGKMIALGSLSDAFGDRAGDVMAEIAPKDPTLAHVGGLVTLGAMDAAEAALNGAEYIALGQKPAYLTPQTIQPEFTNFVGSAFLNNQDARASTYDLAVSIYTARAVDRGLDMYEPDLWQESINLAIGYDPATGNGGIQAVRGQNVILPRSMDASTFSDMLDSIAPEDIARATNQDFYPEMVTQIADDEDWYPIQLGYGEYYFAKGTPGTTDFRYFADPDNNPIILNFDDTSWYSEKTEAVVDVDVPMAEVMVAP